MRSDEGAEVSQSDIDELRKAKVIYIATVRSDGSLSKAAPAWFTLTARDEILLQTRPNTAKAKRIRRRSPVIVRIGGRSGSTFIGWGEITADPAMVGQIVSEFPKKYLLARFGFHRPNREMFDNGQIVAIKITLVAHFSDQLDSKLRTRPPDISKAERTGFVPSTPGPYRHDTHLFLARVPLRAQAANSLSALRFALAAMWLAAFASGERRAAMLGPIAVGAALSDFLDGPIARATGSADGSGRWLDPAADASFVLTALSCEAAAGAMPVYIPVLIAASFAQYAIDSLAIGSGRPVKSRLGHWGGVINYVLVLLLAFAPPLRRPGILLRKLSPAIAIFYLAAMLERAVAYRLARAVSPENSAKPQ